jgi:hypothetical protein
MQNILHSDSFSLLQAYSIYPFVRHIILCAVTSQFYSAPTEYCNWKQTEIRKYLLKAWEMRFIITTCRSEHLNETSFQLDVAPAPEGEADAVPAPAPTHKLFLG